MNYEDERYVRFFTRDTVTWRSWTWEARAVWGLLLRKVSKAGVLDVGRTDPVEALALILEVPLEVAARCLPQWLRTESIETHPAALVIPRFLHAQNVRMSDRARKQHSREAERDAARVRDFEGVGHTPSQPVTPRPTQPSPAQPSPKKKRAPRKRARRDPPVEALELDFGGRAADLAVVRRLREVFRELMGFDYRWSAQEDTPALERLLVGDTTAELVVSVWRAALQHKQFPSIRKVAELDKHWNHLRGLVTQEAPPPQVQACAACGPPRGGRFVVGGFALCDGHVREITEQLGEFAEDLQPHQVEAWLGSRMPGAGSRRVRPAESGHVARGRGGVALSEHERRRLSELILEGLPAKVVGERLGLHWFTVSRWAYRLGLWKRRRCACGAKLRPGNTTGKCYLCRGMHASTRGRAGFRSPTGEWIATGGRG